MPEKGLLIIVGRKSEGVVQQAETSGSMKEGESIHKKWKIKKRFTRRKCILTK
jgi:hypothetical protein